MKIFPLILIFIFSINIASATSYFNTTEDILINLSNGAYINLSSGQNFTNTSDHVVRIYNSTDSPKSTLEINFNGTSVQWNNTFNTTLNNISYNGDILNFYSSSTGGIYNISARMANLSSVFYDFKVDGVINTSLRANSSGWVFFNWSDWSTQQHNFTIQQSIPFIPPTPINPSSTTGNFFVNTTWEPGIGNVTDSYNVSINNTWYNNTLTNYLNITLYPHATVNFSIFAFNNSYGGYLNQTPSIKNTTITNNPVTLTSIGNKNVNEGSLLTFTLTSSDLDGDTPTYSTNATKGSLDINTGIYTWTPLYNEAGVYNFDYGVSDGYGSIDNETITITVNNIPLTITSFSPLLNPTSEYGDIQSFNIQTNHSTTVTWYIDGVLKQTNVGVTTSTYNNSTAIIGAYTVLASATDSFETVTNSWTWTVIANYSLLTSSVSSDKIFKCGDSTISATFDNAGVTAVNAYVYSTQAVHPMIPGSGRITPETQNTTVPLVYNGTHWVGTFGNDATLLWGARSITFGATDSSGYALFPSSSTIFVYNSAGTCTGTGQNSYQNYTSSVGNRTSMLVSSNLNLLEWGLYAWLNLFGYLFFVILVLTLTVSVAMKTQDVFSAFIVSIIVLILLFASNFIPVEYVAFILFIEALIIAATWKRIFTKSE